MQNNAVVALALLLAPGTGRATVRRAIAASVSLETPLAALRTLPRRTLLERLPIHGEDITRALTECPVSCVEQSQRLLERCAGAGTTVFLAGDEAYPTALRNHLGTEAPPVVFVHGNVALLEQTSGAVVGTREPTAGGQRLAAACAKQLTQLGAVVVSGGAPGVDTAAHEAAVAHGGQTVFVLPYGVLEFKGASAVHAALREGRAALLSEFPPNAPWQTHAAVTRNASIAALSRLVCVIEPRKAGGSMQTARCALAQGKPVFLHSSATTIHHMGATALLDGQGRLQAKALRAALDLPAAPAQADLFG